MRGARGAGVWGLAALRRSFGCTRRTLCGRLVVQRCMWGVHPRSTTAAFRMRITALASSRRSTSNAASSQRNSSQIGGHLSHCPSSVRAKTKSELHTWLRRSGRSGSVPLSLLPIRWRLYCRRGTRSSPSSTVVALAWGLPSPLASTAPAPSGRQLVVAPLKFAAIPRPVRRLFRADSLDSVGSHEAVRPLGRPGTRNLRGLPQRA